MAQGYLRSVGMGEFTPKSDQYSKTQPKSDQCSKQNSTQPTVPSTVQTTATLTWKKLDEDEEFEFDV